MSDEVKRQQLPAEYPAYRALAAVGDEVWLIRWSVPARRNETVVDVLNASGSLVRTLVLPAACETVPLMAVRDRVVACRIVDAASGAEGVAVMEVPPGRP